MNVDGSGLQQMTDAGSVYPTWSPDGARMAVGSFGGATALDNKVYLFDPRRPWNAQTPEVLPPAPWKDGLFTVNSWSPDGQRLAGQQTLAPQGIATYSFRTRSFEVLTDFGEFPVWLPDSRRVLFVSGGTDVYVIDADTKQHRKIYTARREVLGPPRLTRDGRAAFFTRRMTESDIWLVTLDADDAGPKGGPTP